MIPDMETALNTTEVDLEAREDLAAASFSTRDTKGIMAVIKVRRVWDLAADLVAQEGLGAAGRASFNLQDITATTAVIMVRREWDPEGNLGVHQEDFMAVEDRMLDIMVAVEWEEDRGDMADPEDLGKKPSLNNTALPRQTRRARQNPHPLAFLKLTNNHHLPRHTLLHPMAARHIHIRINMGRNQLRIERRGHAGDRQAMVWILLAVAQVVL